MKFQITIQDLLKKLRLNTDEIDDVDENLLQSLCYRATFAWAAK